MKRKRKRKILRNKGKVEGKQDQERAQGGSRGPKMKEKRKKLNKRNKGKGKENRTKESPQEGPRKTKLKGNRKKSVDVASM